MLRNAKVILMLWIVSCSWRCHAQSEIIYSNGLQNGWNNWSWATVNLNNTTTVPPGSSSSVSVTSSNYTALYFEHADFDSSSFSNLTFWLNGGSSGGQVLSVTGILGGNNQSVVSLPALVANTWQQFTVSLASIGVGNAPNFDGIWIWNDKNISIPTFFAANFLLTPGGPAGPNPTNFLGIDAGTNRSPISSLIYGVAFATSNQLADLNFTLNRSGGNEESTYNWEINAHGKGADYYFESYPDSSATPGQSADSVVANSKIAGAQPLITIPMMSWGPKLGANRAILPSYLIAKYGPQTGDDPYFTDAGNGVSVTNNTPITWNDPNDSYTPVDTNFQKAYVQHLTNGWGVSTNGGVGYYIMDNEHTLWSSTHQDIHPVGTTMQEILGKFVAYASMVKSVDSNALVLGPEEWGWSGYLYSGFDQQWSGKHGDYNPADYPDRATNGGWDYIPWLLNQLHQHDTNTRQRLLDYFTLHCYPQEGDVSGNDVSSSTELLRNQSTRQFWDSNYVDPSWINSVIMLIPRMKNWVATNYPGTKIGITEYNWGAEPYMSGATAQADILGIFGRQGLDLATRWTTPATNTPTYLAMKMYRNYDGKRSTFGDTSVLANTANPDNVAIFAAQRSTDEALTIMAVNKYLTGTTPLVINVTNFTGTGTAHVWQLNASNVIAALPDVGFTNGLLQATVPNQSVTLFVLPPSSRLNIKPGAPRTDGQFQFFLNGEIGRSVVVQSSSDLINWTTMSTNTLGSTNTALLFSAGTKAAFYRAALSH
jgi:hypothetical protein